MPTPFAPSKIWQRLVDSPIKQDASYKMTAQDRGYIDSQIIGIETLLLAVIGTGLVGFGTADQFYVTNHAGNAAQWQTVSGDVSYASGVMTVTGVRGVSIPNPSGTSTVLTYNAGSLSWTNITSVLSSFGADLAGSTSINQWVAAISGPGGVGSSPLPVHIVGFQFDETQVNPTISQHQRTSDSTVYSMTLAPQKPWASAGSNTTPGSLIVALGAPVGSGANAGFVVSEGGADLFRVGNIAGSGTSFLWLGPQSATPSSTNSTLFVDSSGDGVFLSVPATATVSLSMGIDGGIQATLGTSNTTGNFVIYGGSTGWNIASYKPTYIEWTPSQAQVEQFAVGTVPTTSQYFTALNPNADISTALLPSGSNVTHVGKAITNVTTAPTGGFALWADATTGHPFICVPGGSPFEIVSGSGAFTPGGDLTGSSSAQYIQSLSGASNGGLAIPLKSTAWISVTGNEPIVKVGSSTIISTDGSNNLVLGSGGAEVALSVANLAWPGGAFVALLRGGTTFAQFPGSSSDYVQFGGTPATSGYIRADNNSIIVSAWSVAHSTTMQILSTDSTDDLNIGFGMFGTVRLGSAGITVGGSGLQFTVNTVTGPTSGTISLSASAMQSPYQYINIGSALTNNLTVSFGSGLAAGSMWFVDTTANNSNGHLFKVSMNASTKTLADGFVYLFVITEANSALGVQLTV